MATIGLDQLPADARTVLAQGETLEIIDGGTVVARLVPVAPAQSIRPDLTADLATLDELSARISAAWKDNLSAGEEVDDVRRTLCPSSTRASWSRSCSCRMCITPSAGGPRRAGGAHAPVD